MAWVDGVKAFHILAGLLAFSCVCLYMGALRQRQLATKLLFTVPRLYYVGLSLSVITGLFLVYPKHFTFRTPWIQAALLLAIGLLVLFMVWQRSVKQQPHWWHWLFPCALTIGFSIIIHDAVTKTTQLL